MEHIENEYIEEVEKKEKPNILGILAEMIVYIVLSVIVILLVRTFLIQHVKVSGTSMEPTLHDKQHLFIEKVSYKFNEVERFDVIVFQPFPDNDELFYIKRVIGLPGETVKIENNTIYINGEKLEEEYGYDTYTDAKLAKETIMLGKNDYFVLGDNREVSKDSREKDIGLLNRDLILGKAWMSIYPFDDIRMIHDN